MGDVIKEFWHLILAGVATLVFVLRMEARTSANTNDIDRLWRQRREDLEDARRSRAETHEKLDMVNGKLDRLIERMMK